MLACIQLLAYRKKQGSHGGEFAVSANMAYGEMKLEPVGAGIYEDPDKIVKCVNKENRQLGKQLAGECSVDQSTESEYVNTVGENMKPFQDKRPR